MNYTEIIEGTLFAHQMQNPHGTGKNGYPVEKGSWVSCKS